MHIGYVLKKFPRASETFVLNEILALQRLGVDVTVFSLNRPDDGVFHRGLSELKRPVVYLSPRKPDAWLQLLQKQRRELIARGPALLGELDDLLAAGRPDLWSLFGNAIDLTGLVQQHGVQHLHAHFATVAAYAARGAHTLCGVPFSVTCHAKDIYREGIEPARFRSLLQNTAFVVTVCEANRRWIESSLGADELDLRVLYNGVDTSVFHPAHRTPSPAPLLLAVGRLVEKKGFHVLLDALALLARDGIRPRCVLAGDGEDGAALRAQAARLGLRNVEFVGLCTHDEVRSWIQKAHTMVLPCIVGSDGNRDALPTVLLEALASGLPVISTAIGGVEEIVDDGRAGVLVPAGEAAPLAEAIAAMLGDSQRTRALAIAGRERAERFFDLDSNVATLRGWFARSVATAPGSKAVLA